MIARGPAFRARHSGRRNVGWSLFLSIAATAFGTSPVFAEDIFGTWMRGDNAARVVIAECGTSICATNIWIRDPDKQHEHVGDRLVFKISHNGDSWTGTAYDPQRDLKFSARLQASGTAMTTRGCMFGGLVCKTTIWARQ
jgi:uncharacterized protein (DUF2147 family)